MPRNFTIDWYPLLPGWGIALISVVLLGIVAWGSQVLLRKHLPRRWVIGLGLVRMAAVLLFAACLSQPAISYLRGVARPPELLVLVDTSQSMGQTDGADGKTRLAAAVDELQRNDLVEALGSRFQLKWFAFDRRAYPIEGVDLNSLEPDGESTEFARSLKSAADLLSAQGDSAGTSSLPQRVLLVSDGHDRGGEDFADMAAQAGATVDILVAGGERKATPSAATISRVQTASRVLLASETQFLVTLERGNEPARDYMLTLYEDGKAVQSQDTVLEPGGGEERVQVAYRPVEAGLKRYEFGLRPKGAAADSDTVERHGANVQVIDDKIEVLVLEDRWRWEFKYFRRVLEDDPSFSLTAMLVRGGGTFVQIGEPERRVNLGGFPQSRSELDWFDVLVLGDVRPTRWPGGLREAVADAVIEGGKSLIVVAGPSLAEFAQSPELHTLLPVELTAESAAPLEGPLEIRLTPEGAQSGLFDINTGLPGGELPAVDRIYPPLRKRPGATVLIEAASEANASGRLILLAEHTVGRGRVLYVGTDALWKWQTLTPLDDDGRTLYDKFWQQTLRAFTPRRISATGLWLQADRTRYEAGQRVTLRTESPAAADERMKLDATVVLPDGRRLPLHFEPELVAADTYTARFDAVAPGRYRVALAATVDGQAVAETSTAIEVTASRGESDDTGVDRAALARIAARTGGQIITAADPNSWPTTAEGPPTLVDERRTINLWENLSLLTLLCLVLGSDWLLRMLRGYA